MGKSADFLDALREPADETNGLVTGISPTQRLQLAMRLASQDDPTNIPKPTAYSDFRAGVPNPYGRGVAAFEPNNIIFTAYQQAKTESDVSKAVEDSQKPGTINANFDTGSTGAAYGQAHGQIGQAIQAAMALAQRNVPYVWGGTTANGVDCSGLLYYAFNAAGLKIPRYRAVDYSHIGAAVGSLNDARPGDVIYYDEPGNTDHVGLYIGGGMMIQAPQTGDHVRVSPVGHPTAIRRIFDDSAFGTVATPGGGSLLAYNGAPYTPYLGATASPMANASIPGSTITRPTGRMRAI